MEGTESRGTRGGGGTEVSGGSGEGGDGESRAGSPAGARAGGRRAVGRRALLVAGGAVALGAVGRLASDELSRLWWRLPGTDKPRKEGEVDHRGAEWVPASEANLRRASRPYDYAVDRVVIHIAQATFPITLKVFQDPGHGAASHYVVRSSDGHIAQMVRELDIAYHAGNRDYNERSIGIEHEGWTSRPRYFTDTMYRASAALTAEICDRYGIPRDRHHIIGHSEVPGADHTDPGRHWDWDRYMRMVRQV